MGSLQACSSSIFGIHLHGATARRCGLSTARSPKVHRSLHLGPAQALGKKTIPNYQRAPSLQPVKAVAKVCFCLFPAGSEDMSYVAYVNLAIQKARLVVGQQP